MSWFWESGTAYPQVFRSRGVGEDRVPEVEGILSSLLIGSGSGSSPDCMAFEFMRELSSVLVGVVGAYVYG